VGANLASMKGGGGGVSLEPAYFECKITREQFYDMIYCTFDLGN
jgi:hypothetical protein